MFGSTTSDFQENPWPSKSVLLLPLFLLVIFLIRKYSFTSPNPFKNLPPSPPKLPVIGNLHQLGLSPHKSFRSLSDKHGPLMLLHLGSVPCLVVSSPEAAREILKTHDPIFSNRPRSSVAGAIYDCKDVAFAPNGEHWRRAKSICVNQLLSSRKIQSFRNIREEEIRLLVERVRGSCRDDNEGKRVVIDLGEAFASLTSDVICRVALGRKYRDRKFKEIVETLGVLLGDFNVGEFVPWLAWVKYFNGMNRKIRKVAEEIDEFLEAVVKEHVDGRSERGDEGKDFVDVLLEIQRSEESGFALDAISLKAIVLDMFAAGTDTTYTLIEWTLSELIAHDDIMLELKTELRKIAGSNSSITEDDLDKCQYLKAVVKEALRLHPPLPLLVPRESTQDVRLLGYDISLGTRVVINTWAMGRDPLLWVEPNEFRPERFLNGPVDWKGQFRLIPFGGGRRVCPGAGFAMVIVELVLANLVLNFGFELPSGGKGEDLDMSEGEGITIHRKYPLRVVATCES